jgi:hypothetical protein
VARSHVTHLGDYALHAFWAAANSSDSIRSADRPARLQLEAALGRVVDDHSPRLLAQRQASPRDEFGIEALVIPS